MVVVRESRYSYTETLLRLLNAIANGGNVVFATIDQTAAAQQVGLSLRPTSLIVFGNPKGGTSLMEAVPLVALDLPLKLLVWNDDASVHVAYNPASDLIARYGIPETNVSIPAMDAALKTVVDTIV